MSIRYRRRGRPRNAERRLSTDSGTPELVARRAAHQTDEALDLCLARGLILPEEHAAGMHLRWLYTLRFGAPGARAVAASMLTFTQRSDTPEWRSEREADYLEAMRTLGPQLSQAALALCVFDERPLFLHGGGYAHTLPRHAAAKATRELQLQREALSVLAQLRRSWNRRNAAR